MTELEKLLFSTLEEVRTNGNWTEGEQQGEWQISPEVYAMVCDACLCINGERFVEDFATQFTPTPRTR